MEGNPEISTFKTFVCHICGRIFNRNHRLQSHIRTHNKRKLSLISTVTDNSSSTQGSTKSPAKEIKTVSVVEQPELLQNSLDHNKDFDECASTSPVTDDSSSYQNPLKEDESRTPLMADYNSTEDPSQRKSIEPNEISSMSEEYQSCKSFTENKNEVLDKNSTTPVTNLIKTQIYPTGQIFEHDNIEVLINACDVSVMISETEIANTVDAKITNEVQSGITHEVTEIANDGISTSKKPTSHMLKKVKVNYKCEFCPRTFSNKAHYERHILIHTKVKPHECPVCSRRFAQVGNLNAHYRMHIEKEKNNVDEPEINPEANSEDSPQGCKFRMRTKETVLYICEVCSMQFTSRCYLERHLLTHTKEKPHICSVCFRGFAQIGNLNVHYRTHTNLKTFVCHVCDKAFTLMSSLKAHLLIHMEQKPFECDICGKGFSSKCFLKRHYLTHTNFKPHVCGVCQRGFVQVGNLNVHLLTHLSQNSFKCDVCNKTFARKLYLDRHYKVHTNGKVGTMENENTIENEKVNFKENNIGYSQENNNAQI